MKLYDLIEKLPVIKQFYKHYSPICRHHYQCFKNYTGRYYIRGGKDKAIGQKVIDCTDTAADYQIIYANKAKSYLDLKNKICLIVGCKTGIDCSFFINYGAKEVHGLDICSNIGIDYQHKNVTYHQVSAENMQGINSENYDLVYCLATLEHVSNIELAYKEMVRVTKPNGIIFTFSAPLWHSSQGHHKQIFFKEYPWIHLRMSELDIVDYCKRNNIIDTNNSIDMEYHVKYMLNHKYFNKIPAKKYIDTCNNLEHIVIIKNQLSFSNEKELTSEIYSELERKGYTRDELLASSHFFVARKI